jgi:hypothetical protein
MQVFEQGKSGLYDHGCGGILLVRIGEGIVELPKTKAAALCEPSLACGT